MRPAIVPEPLDDLRAPLAPALWERGRMYVAAPWEGNPAPALKQTRDELVQEFEFEMWALGPAKMGVPSL